MCEKCICSKQRQDIMSCITWARSIGRLPISDDTPITLRTVIEVYADWLAAGDSIKESRCSECG